MDSVIYEKRTRMPVRAEELFAWHARPGAFERLSPPWQAVRLVEHEGSMEDASARLVLSVPVGPVRLRWVAQHTDVEPGRGFTDVQRQGPFAKWEHTHRFLPEDASTSVLLDSIDYRLPLNAVSRFVAGPGVRRDLERVFAYRHRTTLNDLRRHAHYLERKAMNVLITGASGLVGSELIPFLRTGGHEVSALTRGAAASGDGPIWNPDDAYRIVDPSALEGFDGVVHLAGESIASGRWTEARKERIRASRAVGTRALCEALAGLERKPSVLVSASAIGFYGDRGDEVLERDSAPGEGFLAEVCREWEEATEPARAAGIRVVNLRIGVVLSPKGGALQKMLTPFRMGVGGVVGSGDQYMSWISIDDLVGAIHHALMEDGVAGPVNAVAPNPVTNREFTRTLGKVLSRPTIFPLPGFAAKLAMGEMAEELLLSSARVQPSGLQASGFEFAHPRLEQALRHVLGR